MADEQVPQPQPEQQSQPETTAPWRIAEESAKSFNEDLVSSATDPQPEDDPEIYAEEVSDEESEFDADEEPQEEESEHDEQPELDNSPEHIAALEQILAQLGLQPEDLNDPRLRKIAEDGLRLIQAEQAAAENSEEAVEKRYTEHYQELSKVLADPEIMDPRILDDFSQALSRCESPKQQMEVLALGGINLVQTILPMLLPNLIETAIEARYPGMSNSYAEAQIANTWQATVASDPAFAGLPTDIDSPEFQELSESLYSANPWLANLRFNGPDGRPLPVQQNMAEVAKVCARLAVGERLTSKTVKDAYERGLTHARAAQSKVAGSRLAGAGKSKGDFQEARDDDPIERGFLQHLQRQGAFARRK